MRRYWVPKESVNNNLVTITGDVLHHIRDVCRMAKGSKFEVLTEDGRAYFVEVTGEEKRQMTARVLEVREIAPLPKPLIRIALSLPRFPTFEAIAEKAVEMGVASIKPFFSEFSFIRTQSDVFEKKRPRFEKIIQGATQQTGRGDLMPIEPFVSLEKILEDINRHDAATGLFAYEGAARMAVKPALEEMKARMPQEVWVFVGSEGGFSDREVQVFQEQGLLPVTLGEQVLRVETACVALVSVIKYHFDQMQ